jgi:uncharacterized protein YaaR (DUF327 family)
MRVNDIKRASSALKTSTAGDEKKAGFERQRAFERELTTLSRENHRKHIESLVDEITAQGERVSKKADISELQKYKELIIKLLNENASNAFAFEKSDKFDSRGRHKTFAMIRTVNKKLDELTAEVLKEQSENIKIVDLMDDIRGILVDLFL